MRALLIAMYLSATGICAGDTLRISELGEAAGDDAERMILKSDDGEEVLFVKKKAILGDADVDEVWPDPAVGGRLSVKLTKEGGKKLMEATTKMRKGQDRLALIVEGRLISAPIVHATVDSSFVIEGFRDLEFHELDDLARRMSGRPPRPEEDDPVPAAPIPKIETVPFTEQEYQEKKERREKMGIFHLETVPTKEDLEQLLRKGMSPAEVLKLLGRPHLGSTKPQGKDFDWIYTIAPEKRPKNPKREVLPDGFKVDFVDGKLSWWSRTHSDAPREEKVVGREPATLLGIPPEMDLSADGFDLVAYVEAIVIPDPKQTVNSRDLSDLLTIVWSISRVVRDDTKKATLDPNCDLMKTLSHNFSEVAELRKKAEGERVRIDALNETLSPYALGEKPLPIEKKRDEPGGADKP